jgi:hypothetical protein
VKLHTYVVTFQQPYLDDERVLNNLRQAKTGCWCYSRLFGTCHLFYTSMDINEMTEFLKKTVGDTRTGSYIFHETNGEIYKYSITAGDQLKALQDFIDGRAEIDNKISKDKQEQKVIEQEKEVAKKRKRNA